jgi:hypothetical protein
MDSECSADKLPTTAAFVDVADTDAFQRVTISGGAPHSSESREACALLTRCLELRRKHCCKKPVYYWGPLNIADFPDSPRPLHENLANMRTVDRRSTNSASTTHILPAPPAPALQREVTLVEAGGDVRRVPPWRPFSHPTADLEQRINHVCKMVGGVMHIFESLSTSDAALKSPTPHASSPLFNLSSWATFVHDYHIVTHTIHKASVKTFAVRRLELLEARFSLHAKLNVDYETHESKVCARARSACFCARALVMAQKLSNVLPGPMCRALACAAEPSP